MIQSFIHSDAGSVIISALWGFGLAMVFRKVCMDRECITVYGPKPSDVRGKKVKWNDTCYVIEPKEASCDDPDTTMIPVRNS